MSSEQTDTQQILVDSFKELMAEQPFNKITIKMITDKAGVIRPTFYNYFRDKYEVFEVILDKELFQSLYSLLEINMTREAIKMIFTYFGENYRFYKKAFQVTGQNSFEDILTKKIQDLDEYMYGENIAQTINKNSTVLTHNQIIEFYAVNIVLILKMWLVNERVDYDADEIFEAYLFLMSHDLQSLLDESES